VVLPRPKKATYIFSQVEPSICINPNNMDEVIAGSVMNDYYYSSDGGLTWKSKSITAEFGVNGDPCMLIDTKGRYYYFHLSQVNDVPLVGGMVCQRSDVLEGKFKYEGHTLTNGKYHDKEWVALDPRTDHLYMTWTQFDAYDSADPRFKSYILFSKSEDGGLNWSYPVQISTLPGDCQDNDETAEGAVPAIGPNGEIYVCWSRSDTLWFNSSSDDGKTWMTEEMPIAVQPGGWVIDIPGLYRCNGLPVTACDLSNGPHRGTIYVNWADQRNGESNSDIWLISSKDGGQTWTEPSRVNSDSTERQQFFTWMTLDQSSGYLYFVFYDRRNHSGLSTDVYLARSKDGGVTFENFLISETSFSPTDGIFFGDYTGISAVNGNIRPIWMRMDKGRLSLLTAIVSDKDLK
jgi:hypothetical protein